MSRKRKNHHWTRAKRRAKAARPATPAAVQQPVLIDRPVTAELGGVPELCMENICSFLAKSGDYKALCSLRMTNNPCKMAVDEFFKIPKNTPPISFVSLVIYSEERNSFKFELGIMKHFLPLYVVVNEVLEEILPRIASTQVKNEDIVYTIPVRSRKDRVIDYISDVLYEKKIEHLTLCFRNLDDLKHRSKLLGSVKKIDSIDFHTYCIFDDLISEEILSIVKQFSVATIRIFREDIRQSHECQVFAEAKEFVRELVALTNDGLISEYGLDFVVPFNLTDAQLEEIYHSTKSADCVNDVSRESLPNDPNGLPSFKTLEYKWSKSPIPNLPRTA